MDDCEINLEEDLNIIQMDLMDDLFSKWDEQILNQETDLDNCFLLAIKKNSAKIWKDFFF